MLSFLKVSQKLLKCEVSLDNLTRQRPSLCLPSVFLVHRRGITYRLFVGGLSLYTTESLLKDTFSQYGQVLEVRVVTDRVSEKSRGFGFVTFASEEEAHMAVSEMNGKVVNGRTLYVNYAKPDVRRSMYTLPVARGPSK